MRTEVTWYGYVDWHEYLAHEVRHEMIYKPTLVARSVESGQELYRLWSENGLLSFQLDPQRRSPPPIVNWALV